MFERYSAPVHIRTVKIGNWQEEMVLKEDQLKEFLAKNSSKSLECQKMDRRKELALKKIPLATQLVYSQPISLVSDKTKGSLALDLPHTFPTSIADEEMACTTTQVQAKDQQHEFLRNVFVLERVDTELSTLGDEVRYGERVYIKCLDEVSGKPMYICSTQKSYAKFAKRSNYQAVYLSTTRDASAVWRIQYADPEYRLEAEGAPIVPNVPVVLTHCKTNGNLFTAENYIIRNDFDVESEVSVHTVKDANTKVETSENLWSFVVAGSQ